MPFVKKNIHLSHIELEQKIIKKNIHSTIDQHQKIIIAAQNTANNLIFQAKLKAQRLLEKAQADQQRKTLETRQAIQGLIEKTKAQSQEIKDKIIEQTQQEILLEASNLLSSLNQIKQDFFEQHQDFFKSILTDLIESFTQELDLKLKMEIIAQKVIQKAKGLEEAILYFNEIDIKYITHLQLPINWKILIDNDIASQSCKLRAQGSDWHINFRQIETAAVGFFNIN